MRLLIAWVMLSLIIPPSHAQTTSASIPAFPFESREGLLWVKVRISESGRDLNFLLDTGAETSVIDLKLARELNLPLGQHVAVSGVGISTGGYWCETRSAKASVVELPNRLLALDLSALSGSCERQVNGLIGADFFRSRVVQLDFEAGTVRVLGSENLDLAGDSIPMDVRRCGIRAKASINGTKPRWFRVDTGCATPVQWVTGRVSAPDCTAKVAVGLTIVGIPQTKTTVALGNATFTGVETGLHRSAIFAGEAGLLGNGLLRQFKSVTLDTVHRRLVLGDRR